MTTEETIQLIARVLAWQDGYPIEHILAESATVHYLESARQCAEDLGIA